MRLYLPVPDPETPEVLAQLLASGYHVYLGNYQSNGKTLRGTFPNPNVVLHELETDQRFASGAFYGLHKDIGDDLVDFRSYNGKLGKGSLQLVIDEITGNCYADIDKHNPYQDVVRFIGHAFGEVLPNWFKRIFK